MSSSEQFSGSLCRSDSTCCLALAIACRTELGYHYHGKQMDSGSVFAQAMFENKIACLRGQNQRPARTESYEESRVRFLQVGKPPAIPILSGRRRVGGRIRRREGCRRPLLRLRSGQALARSIPHCLKVDIALWAKQ